MSSSRDADGSRGARRRLLVAAFAVLAAVALVWLLVRGVGGGDAAPGADRSMGPIPSPSSSTGPSDAAVPPADPDPSVVPDSAAVPDASAPGDSEAPEQPVEPGPTLPPRPLDDEAPLGEEAVARVSRLEAVEGEPQGVGEVAGPALRFAIELENTGSAPLPVGDAVVNVTYGPDATPATEISGPGRVPFTGDLAPGDVATGVYVFLVPVDARDAVSVSLEYRFGAPIAVFEGSASAAPEG